MRQPRGFTLVEVLVALGIVAIALLAGLQATNALTRNAARQSDVLHLLTEDLTNSEIADRLFISTRTVDHHVSAILDKLVDGDVIEVTLVG